MEVLNSSTEDMSIIFHFFESAVAYQAKNGYPLWPQFSRTLIETEIKEKRHWKITENGEIIAIFSVMYNDPVIWGEKDKDPAVYLHRIAVNPAFKGRNTMKVILHWAILHAKENNKKYLRMDTWGNNENLRNYYIKCGYVYIGQQQLYTKEGQPEHYGGNLLSLFQNKV